jgi:hypothetical protein
MTQQRDIERLLDLWLSDGPTESPDRVIDVVADRVERQPQRPAWRFHLREIHVNTMLRAGIAVAAVVVVAFIGIQLLPGQSGGTGGPAPSPSSIVTAPPSAAPSPSGSSVATECINGQGCPSPFPAGPVTSTVFTPKVSFTAPAGYIPSSDEPQAFGVRTAAGSTPGGFLIVRDPAPSTQANACEGDLDPAIKTYTVDTISAAFAADKAFKVTTPTAVTIGPYSGKTFDIELAPTWTGTCPWSNGKPGALALTVQSGPTPSSPSYGMAAGDPATRVYLLDVGGKPIWIQTDTSAAAQVLPVLQTLSFAP